MQTRVLYFGQLCKFLRYYFNQIMSQVELIQIYQCVNLSGDLFDPVIAAVEDSQSIFFDKRL